jgi:FKBP-type peptidyl-prolyl cis-trans isomerase SlyD
MSEKKRLTVADNIVVTMDFVLKVDDEVIEDSAETDAVQFLQGAGQVLPALEGQIYGMAVGDSKEVVLSPAEGYGDVDPEAFQDVPRSEFAKEIPLQPGVELQLKDKEGHTHYARIDAVDAKHVRLDFNHTLAGKTLHFDIRIAALRTATPEEIEHGHAH